MSVTLACYRLSRQAALNSDGLGRFTGLAMTPVLITKVIEPAVKLHFFVCNWGKIMKIDILADYLAKSLFVLAAIAILVAFLELVAQFLNVSVVFKLYSPGRLIELSALLLIFVIAVLIRQIRDELRKSNS